MALPELTFSPCHRGDLRPEVELLMQHFGVPSRGTEFTKVQLADILNMSITQRRFISAVMAWRRQLMRDHNVYLMVPGPNRLRVATDNEIIDDAARRSEEGRRKSLRAIALAGMTNPNLLSKDRAAVRKRILSHERLLAASVRLAEAVAMR